MQNYDENDSVAAGFARHDEDTTELTLVTSGQIEAHLKNAGAEDRAWLTRQN